MQLQMQVPFDTLLQLCVVMLAQLATCPNQQFLVSCGEG